jgi:hypothetical protein
MSDLRRDVIEAVAEELEADCNAEAAFDAMLGVLSEHADKWGYKPMQPPGVRDLLNLLEGDA